MPILVLFTACGYENLNSLSLPGSKGVGENSFRVRVELSNALNIVPNTPVRVADVNVGTIQEIELVDNLPVLTISLDDSVELPANVTARIGQTSLLGAKHIELIPPPPGKEDGVLAEGSVIGRDQTGSYPQTEDVLAATATLLNGGGLSQIKTIATELNKALGGREGTTRQLLRRAARLATELDTRRGSIIQATKAMNRLMGRLAGGNDTINNALDSFPPALAVLAKDRRRLVRTLESLGDFGTSLSDFVDRGGDNLTRNITALGPSLKGLADAGSSLTDSLWLLGTIAFPLRTFGEYLRGDFINLWGTVDVGLDTLDRGLLSGTPLAGLLSASENLLGQQVTGQAADAGDPLEDPLALGDADASTESGSQDKPGSAPDTEKEPAPDAPEDIVSQILQGLLLGGAQKNGGQ
ncbi:MCE family protein [Nocardioides sp. GCM10030258]|uniref:MCE family protein n=1 Tax=unclassified Nocardioides TaxID=2615069 RepID=UPI003621927A